MMYLVLPWRTAIGRPATRRFVPEMLKIATKLAFSRYFGTYHHNIILRQMTTTCKRFESNGTADAETNFRAMAEFSRHCKYRDHPFAIVPHTGVDRVYTAVDATEYCTTDAVTTVYRTVILWVTAIFSFGQSEMENDYGGRLQFRVIHAAVQFSMILYQMVFALPFAYIIFIFTNNCSYFIAIHNIVIGT